MVKDSWQRKALTEASAVKAREASARERGGHVFWEEKYRDGRNVGREPAGEGCMTEWEKKYQGGGERRQSNCKSGAPCSPIHR